MLRGEYGRLPAEVNEEIRKKAIGDDAVITERPADSLAPEMDKLRAEIAEYIQQDEDVLSYALFGQVAEKYFNYRNSKALGIDGENSDAKLGVHPV